MGPHVGAILGAFVYVLLVGIHFPEDEDADEYEISIDKNGDIGKFVSHTAPSMN